MPTMSFSNLRSSFLDLAAASRPAYWGDCPTCQRATPWYTNAVRGEYRCQRCGHDPVREAGSSDPTRA